MTARSTPFTEEKYQQRLKEGRGRGEGASYRPWVRRDELLSKGTRSLPSCGRTGREMHLLSTSERKAFLFYDACLWVTNVYEQYRLERDETLEIARDLGIAHPIDTDTRVHTVVTTDFVIDAVNPQGKPFRFARSCKLSKDLDVFNNIEHAEIERRYWKRRGIEWRFLTDGEFGISDEVYANLEAMMPNRFLHIEEEPYEGAMQDSCNFVLHAVLEARKSQTLGEFARSVQQHVNGRYSVAQLMLHLIYRGRLVASVANGPFLSQDVLSVASASRAALPVQRRFA